MLPLMRPILLLLALASLTACQAPVVPPIDPPPGPVLVDNEAPPGVSEADVASRMRHQVLKPLSVSPDGEWLVLKRERKEEATFRDSSIIASHWLGYDYQLLHRPSGKLQKLPELALDYADQSVSAYWLPDGRLVYATPKDLSKEQKPGEWRVYDPRSAQDSLLHRFGTLDRTRFLGVKGTVLHADVYGDTGSKQSANIVRLDLSSGQLSSQPLPYPDFYSTTVTEVDPQADRYLLNLTKQHDNKGKYPFTVATAPPPPSSDLAFLDTAGRVAPLRDGLDDSAGGPDLSPDGRHLLVLRSDGIGLLEAGEGRLIRTVPGTQSRWLDAGHVLSLTSAPYTSTIDAKTTLTFSALTDGAPMQREIAGRVTQLAVHGQRIYLQVYRPGNSPEQELVALNWSPAAGLSAPVNLVSPPIGHEFELLSFAQGVPLTLSQPINQRVADQKVHIHALSEAGAQEIYSPPAYEPASFRFVYDSKTWSLCNC